MGCCVSVEQSSVGIIERWGKFQGVASPGCHCLNWACGEWINGTVSLRIQQLDVGCETKTSDNVFVTVTVSVQYQVILENVYDAHYKLSHPRSQIEAYVFDVVRATVPGISLDDVFSKKDDIAVAVKRELDKVMSNFGFAILQTLVVDIDPDKTVKSAMNEIKAAQTLREAATDKAEAEKILQVKAAEAEAESKYLSGQGIARQRKAIVDGLRESVLTFSGNVEGTSPKDVMDLVLVTQYFDTLKDIGATNRSNTVFIPHSPGAVSSVAGEIRSGFI